MPKNRLTEYKSAFDFLFSFIRPHKLWYIVTSVSTLLLVGASIIQAHVTARLIDSSIEGKINSVLYFISVFTVIVLTTTLLQYGNKFSSSKLAALVSRDMKRGICKTLLYAKYETIVKLKSGDTISTLNTDTMAVCDFVAGDFTKLFSQITMGVGALIYLIHIKPLLCLTTMAYTPIGMFFTLTLNKKMNRLYQCSADYKGEALSATEQAFSAIPVIKSFLMEKRVTARIHARNETVYQTEMKISVWNALLQPACSSTARIPQILYLCYSGYLVMKGSLSIGTFIAVFDLINYIIAPTVLLPFILNSLNKAAASINRIQKLQSLAQAPSKLRRDSLNGAPSLEVCNLSFGYDEKGRVIRNFSFSHYGNGIVALCGESGVGKTTLLDIIGGLHTPQEGSICVSGSLAAAPQDTYLFSVSAMENIRLGRPEASDAEVVSAAQAVGAHEFIQALPDGYNTILGDGYADLSGGQKQRISLARIILAKASVWLMDEPTSSLDKHTECAVAECIRQAAKEKLIIISTHRKTLIDCADQVVYLKGGSNSND